MLLNLEFILFYISYLTTEFEWRAVFRMVCFHREQTKEIKKNVKSEKEEKRIKKITK